MRRGNSSKVRKSGRESRVRKALDGGERFLKPEGMFGEFVSAKKFQNMVQEMKLKAFTYNLVLNLSKF